MEEKKQKIEQNKSNHAPGRGSDKQHKTDRDYSIEKQDKSKKGNIKDHPGEQSTD